MTDTASYLGEKYLLPQTEPGQDTGHIRDVLVDADVLVALAKSDDSNHSRAVGLSERLQKEGVSFCLSPFAVPEASTVLSYKVSHGAAKKFLRQMRKLDLSIIELPEKYRTMADEWFLKQEKKGTSYFGCYNMALLDRYKRQLEAIFSFDSIYKRNGFTLVENLKL